MLKKNIETSLVLNAKQFPEKKMLLPISKYFICELNFLPFKRIDSSAKRVDIRILITRQL